MKAIDMKKIYIAFLGIMLSVSAFAQNFNSAYFLDGYKYRHRLNPAFASTRGYFGLPAVGGISVYVQSDLGMSTLLYPYGDRLTTFMNSSVSADEFLGKLKKNNYLGADVSANIISVGAWGNKGFTSVELNVKGSANVNLPYDLFDFMKNAGARQSYDISNLGVRANAYAELSIGHSRSITEHLNIGAKVKLLVGLANVRAQIDNMNLLMTEDKWAVTANGSLSASVPGLVIPTRAESGAEITGSQSPDDLDFNNISFDADRLMSDLSSSLGFGAAIDLGAEYRFGGILEGLNVSAAILDLGFISWGSGLSATTGEIGWEFDGFDDVSFDEGSDNTIGNQFEAMGDDLLNMLNFHKDQSGKARTDMLSCTLNLAAEYEMPFYHKMSVGFLYSSRIAGPYSKNEGRFSLNLSPAKWFGLSASYGISDLGSSLGGVINFDLPGFGLFVGTDYVFWNVTPPIDGLGFGLPYNKLRLNLNFGLTFNISRYRTLGDWR